MDVCAEKHVSPLLLRGDSLLHSFAFLAGEVLAETVWPTRCALCDAPGEVLCDACKRKLPHIDTWQACPVCGAPYGLVQCTECNKVLLAAQGLDKVPYDRCASAVPLDATTGRLVSLYKDAGEQRLCLELAKLMAPYVNPAWRPLDTITYVAASRAALQKRGFDHAYLLACALGSLLGLPVAQLFLPSRAHDQRKLGRSERLANMEQSLALVPGVVVPENVLLIDDVSTTGATLYAGSTLLKQAGAKRVFCLTFAKTF